MKAACTASGFSGVPMPSSVVMSRPAARLTGNVHEHRAGAALPEAAPEFRTAERERSAQRIEQRLRWIPAVNRYRLAIETERISRDGRNLTGGSGKGEGGS